MHSAIISGSLGCSEINYKFNFDGKKDDIIIDALGLGGQDPLYKFQCRGI